MFDKKVKYIDARGHVLGRLSSIVAKELLCGQKVALLRCEDVVVNGPLYRNKMKFLSFLRKKSNTNPRKCSHIHYRAPSRIIKRTIRGMIRHKHARGREALSRLRTFDGIPPAVAKKPRVVVPEALRLLKIRQERKVTRIGDLSSQVGWKYDDVVQRLEAKRKAAGSVFHEEKLAKKAAMKDATAKATEQLAPAEKQILEYFGY